MKTKELITLFIVLILFPLACAAPSYADGYDTDEESSEISTPQDISPLAVTTWYERKVINKSKTSNALGAPVIAECSVGRAGTTCTITSGKTATRTIQLGLGITRQSVASSLSISASSSVTISVSCTSNAMKVGEVFRAKARGDRWTYKVQRQQYMSTGVPGAQPVKVGGLQTSGTLSAFNPYSNRMYCY